MPYARLLAHGRHHPHRMAGLAQGRVQGAQAGRADAVVVGEQNLH
jgi:hypothetical protein